VTNCSRLALTLMSTSVRTWSTVVEYSFEQTAIDRVAGMTTKLFEIFGLGESLLSATPRHNHCYNAAFVHAPASHPRASPVHYRTSYEAGIQNSVAIVASPTAFQHASPPG